VCVFFVILLLLLFIFFLYNGMGYSEAVGNAFTTKNLTIGRVSTVPITVDTRPISHVSY
jgi:hypothetical protein